MTNRTYTAWAQYDNGDRIEYTGLTRSRALWRYHWFNRHPKHFKAFGWRVED